MADVRHSLRDAQLAAGHGRGLTHFDDFDLGTFMVSEIAPSRLVPEGGGDPRRAAREPAAARGAAGLLRPRPRHRGDRGVPAHAPQLAALPAGARRAGARAVTSSSGRRSLPSTSRSWPMPLPKGRAAVWTAHGCPQAPGRIGSPSPWSPAEQPTAPTSTPSSAYAFRGPARYHVPGHKGGPGRRSRRAEGDRRGRSGRRRPAGHPRDRPRPVADAV